MYPMYLMRYLVRFHAIMNTNRWLVENENDACDAVRGTTLGLPTEIDYDDLMEQALAGEVDWVPASYTYSSGPFISSWVPYIVVTQTYSTNMLCYYIILYYIILYCTGLYYCTNNDRVRPLMAQQLQMHPISYTEYYLSREKIVFEG